MNKINLFIINYEKIFYSSNSKRILSPSLIPCLLRVKSVFNAWPFPIKIHFLDFNSGNLLNKLFNEIAPQYEGRVGGYTSIVKMQPRRGDNADVALLQLV